MNDKKKGVKQTQKKQTFSGATKAPGNDPYQNLNRLIQTLNKKTVCFEFEENVFYYFSKQMEKTEMVLTLYESEEKRKIKNPTEFDMDTIFDELKEYIRQNGIIPFIRKSERKITILSYWEKLTGDTIRYPEPLYIFSATSTKGDTIHAESEDYVKRFFFPKNATITKIKIPPNNTEKRINTESISPPELKMAIIQEFLEQFFKGLWTQRYFSVPSNYDYWDALLLLFTGNPGLFRKAAFKKAWKERTPEEQAEVEAETQKIISVMEVEDPRHNTIKGVDAIKIYTPKMDIHLKKITDETGTAGDILFDEITPKRKNRELFNDFEYLREKTLKNFYDTIGSPEGLRHFMAILEGLDDAGQKGFYTFKMDEHLDRLGFKKHNKSHRVTHKQKAIEVIRTLSNTVLEVEDPENEKYNVSFTLLKTSVRHDKITRKVEDLIISMDPWYIHAFQGTKKKEPQFMRLLKELPKENHRDHPYTLLLTPRLALYWRVSKQPEKTLMLSNILAFLNINNSKTYKENIRILESELNYMKSRDHLGDWYHNGDHEKIAESTNPEKIKITFVAPDWAIKEINDMKENHENYLSLKPGEEIKPMTRTEFLEIYEYLLKRYSQREMARHMGISRTNLSNFKSGKRSVTDEMAQKIRAFYFEELKKVPGSDGN